MCDIIYAGLDQGHQAAWGRILSAGAITFVIVEIKKSVRRRFATEWQAGSQTLI